MMTIATHKAHDTTTECVLFVPFELSEKTWKLGFTKRYSVAREIWSVLQISRIEFVLSGLPKVLE